MTARRTFGCPAWYVSGKLFACVCRDWVVLKLPAPEIAELLASGDGQPFRPMGDTGAG